LHAASFAAFFSDQADFMVLFALIHVKVKQHAAAAELHGKGRDSRDKFITWADLLFLEFLTGVHHRFGGSLSTLDFREAVYVDLLQK
jgi:hypothetical protein